MNNETENEVMEEETGDAEVAAAAQRAQDMAQEEAEKEAARVAAAQADEREPVQRLSPRAPSCRGARAVMLMG